MTRPFTIDLGWNAFLADLNVRPADLLRAARLPDDLFTRARPTLETTEFFRLWDALVAALGVPDPGLLIGTAASAETFSPPLFAAFCSTDLSSALSRLKTYKPLIGPLKLDVLDLGIGLEATYGADFGTEIPDEFVATELVFLVHMARLATRHQIRPIAVEMTNPPVVQSYAEFFGLVPREGPFNRLVFSPEDAKRPFLSANPTLFAAFETDLRTRLDEIQASAGVSERVRAALMEALPSGQAEIAPVSSRLGFSPRSLQRKLTAEGTSFKAELASLRERLARDYLINTRHSSAEISFLLGYEDPNSFIRAFHSWTGTTPEALRAETRK